MESGRVKLMSEFRFVNKKFIVILLSLFFSKDVCGRGHLEGLTLKNEVAKMTTSVIVPCVARHFFWLSGMLEAYQNQTVRPDEIVISLSEVENLSSREIDFLELGNWDFKLKVLRNQGKIMDGENRTIAMDNATGDILLFSDADDIPHPQRVEIVKYIFENYEVEHILHAYSFSRAGIFPLNIDDIKVLKFPSFMDVINYSARTNVPITAGSPCFLKSIGKAIKWHGTQDHDYNRQVYDLFKKNIVIPLNLILYRVNLTSHQ
jgi:hypothetical protein